MYRNSEGYKDPTAGVALRGNGNDRERARHQSRERRLDEMQAREDYEVTIRAIRKLAEQSGFEFTRDIWLVRTATGKIYKGG